MKKYFYKTIKNIKNISKLEYYRLFLKVNKCDFLLIMINSLKWKNKNICFETGGKRSFNSFFGLSRMSIKNIGKNGFINGLRKISW